MPYSEIMIRPMREELTQAGFQELRSAADVDSFLAHKEGTALVVINSVCGCAAGGARPGARQALAGDVRPDRIGTVFAGQDVEATARLRSYFADIPPSSPSMALFKDGALAYFLPRHRIEGRDMEEVAADLEQAFRQFCVPVAVG